ncbi:protein of unknown function [Streptomyces sp. 3213]|uniref:DUF397 domain-containing protein n=1 Tax=Streptomyces sp. 3213.3 TaxID=1855348 RepID=UPI0008969A93|nr:DUF397 domain-containing protein [Streptomyces sp. 3213.3]SED97779.1 protein of unknown function [Streptomyces sp. 3213] [Streptomyces sp. 3213.3]
MPAFEFVKSSYSGGNAGQECVEVARNVPGTVAVRDSKDMDGPIVRLNPATWATFVALTKVTR